MLQALRILVGMLFGLLGMGMLTIALVVGSYALAALAGAGLPQEKAILGVLLLISGSIAAVWIMLALRISGATTSRASIGEMVLAILVMLEGLLFVVRYWYPYPSTHARGLVFGVVVLVSVLLYVVMIVASRTRARETPAAPSE